MVFFEDVIVLFVVGIELKYDVVDLTVDVFSVLPKL